MNNNDIKNMNNNDNNDNNNYTDNNNFNDNNNYYHKINKSKGIIARRKSATIFEPWTKNIIKNIQKELLKNDENQVLELSIDRGINIPENCTIAR